ncbi:hypothetical protein SDRG_13040 [Saprolegnia diclina VS20]|uniref:subtilisin n=1 Tax=Saprolegnia diclina (strain VS20) TaxID=1156394 RepID=T0RH78_SAPDV|nr:hypothetical protein SDRG_13040 [Saprolegnia diclina VS20]EQC29167.1 hypothetical protein SDRG_13040 [Saprolegnia diclina VS20]|eukprot:XP_008617345.1 hypothetical protein SDRG_13040 [Saprolegnia diclina VS20]
MKAALILAAIATATHAKVASSVLRALEVDGATDVFVRFADSPLESGEIAEGATRQEVFEILSERTEEASKSIDDVTKGLETKTLWIVPGTFIKAADQATVDKLAQHRGIKTIEHLPEISLDPVLTQTTADATAAANATIQWGVQTVGAPDVWKHFDGKGVVIGSIDTGARYTHELIKDSWRADRGWYDPYDHSAFPEDFDGHGTHTIGTMTGKNGFGVAPGAQWISCRGLYKGTGTSQALLDAKTLQVAGNGECLDAFRDGDKFGLHTYACDATNGNQKWIIDAADHKIKHATHNNLCLDVDPTNPTHAAQVWECHNWNTNQWIDAVAY